MRWNLRMKAAERGIWKSTEMRRLLAEAGLEISAGKMSALWIGDPVTIRLDDLDVICSVLDCAPVGPADLRAGQGRRPPPGQGPGGLAAPGRPGAGTAPVGAPGMTGIDAHVPGVRDPAACDAGDPVLL